MGNTGAGFHFLISTIFDIFAFIVMLRFIMQFTRADFSNPIGELIVKATNPFLLPLRKIIPGLRGYDIPAIVLVFLILLAKYLLLSALGMLGAGGWAGTVFFAALGVIGTAIDVFFITILVRVILSWVAPGGHMLSGLLHSVTSPVLGPLQKIVPPFSGFDLSPLVALILLQFLKIVIGV